jgi:hypothetical protein
MKIFISSLIGGFEELRAAARSAIVALRHEPVMAEDFAFPCTNPHRAHAASRPYVAVSSTDKVKLGSSAEVILYIVKH